MPTITLRITNVNAAMMIAIATVAVVIAAMTTATTVTVTFLVSATNAKVATPMANVLALVAKT
jgi:hypothetical protein